MSSNPAPPTLRALAADGRCPAAPYARHTCSLYVLAQEETAGRLWEPKSGLTQSVRTATSRVAVCRAWHNRAGMSEPDLQPIAYVLAVRDLPGSAAYFADVLGFKRDWNDGENWQALIRGGVRVMLGRCPDALPPAELGDS